MAGNWLEEGRGDLAAQRILDAAGGLFAERGVTAVGMGDVARAAGCSRATLYRYFDSRETLRAAYVHREARRVGREIAATMAAQGDPSERLVDGVVESLQRVRRDPTLASWFGPGAAGIGSSLAHSSAVIESMVAAFLGDPSEPDTVRRARWLVRVIVSLLTVPGADDAEERAMIHDFVAPVVAPAPAPSPAVST